MSDDIKFKKSDSSKEPNEKRESLEEMIYSINRKIQNAEVLNGGFEKLRNEVSEIRGTQIRMETEIKSIRAGEHVFKEKITEINDAIYDPDNGIYRRINEGIIFDKQRDEKLDKAVEQMQKIEDIIKPIDNTEKSLKKIAGEDLKELQTIVKTRELLSKMVWVMVTALFGGGIKLLFDLISAINEQ